MAGPFLLCTLVAVLPGTARAQAISGPEPAPRAECAPPKATEGPRLWITRETTFALVVDGEFRGVYGASYPATPRELGLPDLESIRSVGTRQPTELSEVDRRQLDLPSGVEIITFVCTGERGG